MHSLMLVLVGIVAAVDWDEPTKLDEYVHYDDGCYGWEELVKYDYPGVEMWTVNMTSQCWMGDGFSTQPVWWHQLIVAIPHEVVYPDAALMAIDGGSNRLPSNPPGKDSWGNLAAAYFANETGSVVAYIRQIPNQPIRFYNDPSERDRSEDAQIAWTWRSYLDELLDGKEDEEIDSHMIARFPMTKGAKRGLDAIAEIAYEKRGLNITRFAVGGASKRGWTTWSVAAVDKRVIGIAPMVMSLLNMPETVMHHFQSMDGAYSFALNPYFAEGLTPFLTDPLADELWRYEDMYTYKERLTLPKLVISATGDEFFLCTDSHYWWDDMPKGKLWFMMNPNSEHSLFPHYIAIYNNLGAFWLSIMNDIDFPEVEWEREETEDGGTVTLWTNWEPTSVRGFRSETLGNTTRRDWRLAAGEPGDIALQPVWWNRRPVDVISEDPEEGYRYSLTQDKVDGEWVATFIQVTFDGPDGFEFRMTSEVHVVPDTFPHPPCSGEDCYGYLV